MKGRKGDAAALAERLGVSKRLAALVLGKFQHIEDPDAVAEAASEFLSPDIGRLYDAALMKDMDRALTTLGGAVSAQKKTLVIGDYDVDGVMGALILCTVFKKALNSVSHFIPHRVDDGYGINEKIVESAYGDGVGLIVTCDNGISAHASLKLAKSLGMDVIVTDHHAVPESGGEAEPGDGGLPEADAVVNPLRADCGYPFRDLCGAAVAHKLATAFANRMGIELTRAERDDLFCFAAIATVCDIVELVDENRRIVYHGLKMLNAGVGNPGLARLIDKCGLSGRELTTYEIGHIIGPCINAAGRLGSAELSYDLLTESNPRKLDEIAGRLIELNSLRRDLTAQAHDKAVADISREGLSGDGIIISYVPGIHESICGIVAGILKEKYARPVLILTDSQSGVLKGSGRSVEGCDLLNCVKSVKHRLVRYGGHKMAVGVSVEPEMLRAFRGELNKTGGLPADALTPKEMIDLCLSPTDITNDLIYEASRLAPFGRGNEKPVFALKNAEIEQISLIGSRRNAVKMRVRLENSRADGRKAEIGTARRRRPPLIDAVYFGDVGLLLDKLELKDGGGGALTPGGGRAARYALRDDPASDNAPLMKVDMTFYPEFNDYNGVRRIQLVIRSVRLAE